MVGDSGAELPDADADELHSREAALASGGEESRNGGNTGADLRGPCITALHHMRRRTNPVPAPASGANLSLLLLSCAILLPVRALAAGTGAALPWAWRENA